MRAPGVNVLLVTGCLFLVFAFFVMFSGIVEWTYIEALNPHYVEDEAQGMMLYRFTTGVIYFLIGILAIVFRRELQKGVFVITIGAFSAAVGVTSTIIGDHGLFILAIVFALAAALIIGASKNLLEFRK